MKIARIDVTPLRVPLKEPYYWSHGVLDAAETVLVAIHTDAGITGFGEAMSCGGGHAPPAFLQAAGGGCRGARPPSPQALFARHHSPTLPHPRHLGGRRFAATVLAGLDMALWDIAGKAAGRPLHALLGGAMRDEIAYFGFPQGGEPEQIARSAQTWVERGAEVIYVKVGRGDDLDHAIVRAVRAAIGDRRLRVDANEAWDVLTARRMIRRLAPYDIEFLEQPTPSASLQALKAVRAHSPIPIAADQIAYAPEDVLALCRESAADLIVIGLHEAGSVAKFRECAAIAAAAGINICLHGLYETGISTCASLHAAAVIANLDDGNQFMNHLLVEDVIQGSALALERGRLPLLTGPGLGFELDWDAVGRAHERHRAHYGERTGQ